MTERRESKYKGKIQTGGRGEEMKGSDWEAKRCQHNIGGNTLHWVLKQQYL